MTRVSWDEDGFVRGFPYHDGFLDGVMAGDSGKEVHLALRSTGGERRILTLWNVVAFHVEGFREANIVLNLRILPAVGIESDAGVQGILAERLFLEPGNLRGASNVFLLESSFGAEVVALCGEVEISDVGARLAPAR